MLDWHPTILHDLHEAQSYLYVSTGTGPYNASLDPIAIDEWWLLGETEVMEMAKRGVPGVWTYGFYDGWVPNYLFWIALTHNSFGRFYEVQSYGPDVNPNLTLPATTTSREWYRPNPPLPSITWGPRNNTNIQESALLLAMNQVAKSKELYLENYYLKNKRSIDKGKNGPTYAWLIPAGQRRKADAADMVNDLRTQGVEVSRADAAFSAGSVDVAAGDYIVRGDQPYRTLADMYFSIQNYPVGNPNPYDDTGWTMQYMRDVKLVPLTDASVLQKPMTMLTADARAAGGIEGTGSVLLVDHTGDNNLDGLPFPKSRPPHDGRRGGFRDRRPQIPRRRLHHPRCRPRPHRAAIAGTRTFRVGRVRGAAGEKPRAHHAAHRLRTLLVQHAKRRLDARRARLLQDPVHVLRRQTAARRRPAREVRRDRIPHRRRHVAIHAHRRQAATSRFRTRRPISRPISGRSILPTISAAAWVLTACWSFPNSCRRAAP